MKQKILIFTATYNESENITVLVNSILALNLNANILVVDDNSPDGTGSILMGMGKENKRIKVIIRDEKLGLGSAHKLAFKYAKKHNYDVLITLDADHSHNPMDIPRLMEQLQNYDFVIGSRYVKGGSCNYSGYRKFISLAANFSSKILLNMPINELTTSFRAFNRKAIDKISQRRILSQGYSFFLESIYNIQISGLKIGEIPINFIDRKHGTSKIPKFEAINGIVSLNRLFFSRIRSHRGEYQANILPSIVCPNCKSDYLIEIFSDVRAKNCEDGVQAYKCTSMSHSSKPQVVECLECGLKFAPNTVNDLSYLQSYKDVEDSLYLENIGARKKTFKKVLRKIPSPRKEKNKLLEIGAYCGIFGLEAVNYGWQYKGVEPSSWASNYAKQNLGLDVYAGTLHENAYRLDSKYDLIASWDVLEHVQDPFVFLDLVHEKLDDNGHFCFSTIDIDSMFAKFCGKNWPWIMDMHVYYFSTNMLRKILEKHGFEILEVKTYFHWVSLKYFLTKVSNLTPRPISTAFGFFSKVPFFDFIFPVGFGDVKLYVCKKKKPNILGPHNG